MAWQSGHVVTKEQLDDALFQVRGFIPLIVTGPGSLIRSFEGYDEPKPDHYRGVPVEVHPGWGERIEVVPMGSDY